MPSAATVDALRSGVYLNGTNIDKPLMVLSAWILGGLVLIFANFAIRRKLANKGTAKKTKVSAKAEKVTTPKDEVAETKLPAAKKKASPAKKKSTAKKSTK
jgi:hypothetical protein